MAIRATDDDFVQLLTLHQVRLKSYAITLAPFGFDADEIYQNSCLAIWKKRSEFDASRDFFPWACGFVLRETLMYRRKKARDKLQFEDALVNTLAVEYLDHEANSSPGIEYLPECMAKLKEQDRRLLADRYRANIMPKDLALDRGVASTTVYSALARIRESLRLCIKAKMSQESAV